jgi:diphthine methyl ester synthase
MLYLVGLGLADEKDITVRGLEIVKKAERVYLEAYTAVLLVDKEALVSGGIDLCSLGLHH